MSYHLGIFVDSDETLEQFAREVERVLDIPLEGRSDEYETWYEYDGPEVYLSVREHDLENNLDLRFEDYRYDIAIWPRRIPPIDETRRRWRTELAPALFEKFKATRRYPVMLVEGVQHKLAEYHPAAEVAHSAG